MFRFKIIILSILLLNASCNTVPSIKFDKKNFYNYWVEGKEYTKDDICNWCDFVTKDISSAVPFMDRERNREDEIFIEDMWLWAGYLNIEDMDNESYFIGLGNHLYEKGRYGEGKNIYIVYIEIYPRKIYLERIGLDKYKCLVIDDCMW